MPVSSNLDGFPELGNKLNAMESSCISRDNTEAQNNSGGGGGGGNNVPSYIPCVPFFNSLLSDIESWFDRDEIIEQRKNTIASMFVEVKTVLGLKETFEKFMNDQGTEIPKKFYTSWDELNNVTIGSAFDNVFNASGFWDELLTRPNDYYANDSAETFIETDNTTYLDGDDQREWQRSEDERTRLAVEIGNHTQYVLDESGYTIDGLLESDSTFAQGYNKY
jgi:hypothetical protein